MNDKPIQISEEEAKEIAQNTGMSFGVGIKENLDFLLEKKGQEGMKKLEEAMKSLGYNFEYKSFKIGRWYPITFDFTLLAVMKKLFDLNEESFKEMGRFAARVSPISRIMMKYFFTIDKTLAKAGEYWRKYYTEGILELEKMEKEKKYFVMILKNFPGYSMFCRYLEGYFWQIATYTLPKENLKSEEIECPLKKGKNHRFKISW